MAYIEIIDKKRILNTYCLKGFKKNPKANNAVFKVNFKKPLNAKKEYYQKLIFK